MDLPDRNWYFSNMAPVNEIPVFTLFGETEHFPDIVHYERISARAPANDWRISAHRHVDMAQLFLISSGAAEARVDGKSIALMSGMFLFVPAQCVHGFVFEPGTEGGVLSFPGSVVQSIAPDAQKLLTDLALPFSGSSTGSLQKTADLLAETLAATRTYRSQCALGLAHTALAYLAEQAPRPDALEQTSEDPRLRVFDRLIAQSLGTGWSAGDYASAMSLSTGHLSRLCRASTGRGAAAYLELRIMEEACRLLAFTSMPVAEIGYRLGFTDPSYFSKRFRIARQEAPSAYRARFVS